MQQANRKVDRKVERVAHPAAAIYTKHKAKQHRANRKVVFSKCFAIFLKIENTHPTIE